MDCSKEIAELIYAILEKHEYVEYNGFQELELFRCSITYGDGIEFTAFGHCLPFDYGKKGEEAVDKVREYSVIPKNAVVWMDFDIAIDKHKEYVCFRVLG